MNKKQGKTEYCSLMDVFKEMGFTEKELDSLRKEMLFREAKASAQLAIKKKGKNPLIQ